jgi:N-acetylglutamate synthase-like GNAT family acetyltransferase
MLRSVPPKLRAQPLRENERGALASALRKAGLPVDELDVPGRLFFRFERLDDVPVGFGGLEIFGPDALLRSVITLPPLRKQGIGGAIVSALEGEAAAHKCGAIYLLTTDAARFFERLGYARCERADLPASIRGSRQFTTFCPESAIAMVKRIS